MWAIAQFSWRCETLQWCVAVEERGLRGGADSYIDRGSVSEGKASSGRECQSCVNSGLHMPSSRRLVTSCAASRLRSVRLSADTCVLL